MQITSSLMGFSGGLNVRSFWLLDRETENTPDNYINR